MKGKGWYLGFLLWVMCILLAGCGVGKEAAEKAEEGTIESTAENMVESTVKNTIENTAESTTETETKVSSAKESTEEEPTGNDLKEVSGESVPKSTQGPAREESEERKESEASDEAAPLEEYTGPVQAFEAPKTLYAAIGLNIRKGPGTEYRIVGGLTKNQAVNATGMTENGWMQLMINEQICFASGNYLSETKPEAEEASKAEAAKAEAARAEAASSPAAANDPAAPNTGADTANPAAAPSAPAPNPAPQGGIIMIGDSRCVQMQSAVGGGGCTWICENGKGYKWLSETAIVLADPAVGNGTKVVFCLGVNDPGNVRNYAQLVNAKASEWAGRGAVVYYVSVNPVWENPYVTQEQVDNFNNTMPGLLSGVIWVDTQSWLKENGCRIVDGLHYDDPTSTNIFNLIMGSI